MATITVKSTFSLDIASVEALETIARRWGVSKSAALRRVLRAAAEELPPEPETTVEALDALQRSIALDAEAADRWVAQVQAERRALASRLR